MCAGGPLFFICDDMAWSSEAIDLAFPWGSQLDKNVRSIRALTEVACLLLKHGRLFEYKPLRDRSRKIRVCTPHMQDLLGRSRYSKVRRVIYAIKDNNWSLFWFASSSTDYPHSFSNSIFSNNVSLELEAFINKSRSHPNWASSPLQHAHKDASIPDSTRKSLSWSFRSYFALWCERGRRTTQRDQEFRQRRKWEFIISWKLSIVICYNSWTPGEPKMVRIGCENAKY